MSVGAHLIDQSEQSPRTAARLAKAMTAIRAAAANFMDGFDGCCRGHRGIWGDCLCKGRWKVTITA